MTGNHHTPGLPNGWHKRHVSAFDRFRVAVLAHDFHRAVAEMDENVELYNPASSQPLVGREAARQTFAVLDWVFSEFEHLYVLEEPSDSPAESRRQAIVFRGKAGPEEIQGVDLIEVENDKIVRFTVMVRPIVGLMALGQAIQTAREASPG